VNVVPLEPEHAGERLRHALIVVDDKNRGHCPIRHRSGHEVIVTDEASPAEELIRNHGKLRGFYLLLQRFGGAR
jgi:hypothetical protein